MASINQLVSEIAHTFKQPNNEALREQIRNVIIHTRAEIIRRSYENHNYIDKGLTQRYRVSLVSVSDGDIQVPEHVNINLIKRTTNKVPVPIRKPNNLPFDRVSTVGWRDNREYPYIKETTARFRSSVPGLNNMTCYDYINGYIYLFPICRPISQNYIIIESAFEDPTKIQLENGEISAIDAINDDNEWLLNEDMFGQLKDIILKRDLSIYLRENNETPNPVNINS